MRVVLTAACLLVLASPAFAAEGYGQVAFANSGAPAAQADFLAGLALLHDFEYRPAAAAFQRAAAADPGFALAYWGEAMTHTHPIWMQQDRDAALAALKKLAPTAAARRAKAKTDREKAYLDAVEILYGDGGKEERDVRYRDAMAKVHDRYPDDVDAAAFYGLSILGTAHAGRDVATYMRAAGVLEPAWVDHREHPGLVHYLIHCYDDPAHAPLGLRAARIYAKIAPDAGHAQHMTSHIFLPLGMWKESVDANVAAMAADDRLRKAQGRDPTCCGHYASWLAYAYLQLGRAADAKKGLACCRASLETQPQAHADHGPATATDPGNMAASFANMRLGYLLDTGDWTGEVAGWPLPRDAGPGVRFDFAFGRVLGEIARGHTAGARAALTEMEAAGREVADVETKRGDADPTDRMRPEILLLEARALLAERSGDVAGADTLLRRAVALEDRLPIAFGPPRIDKPTHELLGEFLARHGKRDEARAQFETALARTPGRRLAVQGFEKTSARVEVLPR